MNQNLFMFATSMKQGLRNKIANDNCSKETA